MHPFRLQLPSSTPPYQIPSSPAPPFQLPSAATPLPFSSHPYSPLLISSSALLPSHPATLYSFLALPFQLSYPLFQPLLLLLPSSFPYPLITLSSSSPYPPDSLPSPSAPLQFFFPPLSSCSLPLKLPCHPAKLPSSSPLRPYPPGPLPFSSLPTRFQLLYTPFPSPP